MREGLGEGYDAYIGFVNALESFGGGHNDPICVAFGGSVMTKFTISLREIGTYEEVLHSQVEHMLNDRLLQFVNVDVQEVKEARKRFDKASITYDQAREKYISLKKSTRLNVATTIEERKNHVRASPVSSGNHFVFKYDEFPRDVSYYIKWSPLSIRPDHKRLLAIEENAQDQMDWIEKITRVIAFLLSFQTPERAIMRLSTVDGCDTFSASDSRSLADPYDIE